MTEKKKTVAFHNLGCKVNAYESDIMQQKFEERGYSVVSFTQKADVYVINTCTVTNIADRKSRQMLHRAKAMNPDCVVIATGCYVQTDSENVKKDPSVDIILGNNRKTEVINALESFLNERKKEKYCDIIDINGPVGYESMFLTNSLDRTRAYIKIQDGCNQFCSYCLIPFARGRVRSRDMEEILKEIEGLTQKGYKEFVLTGIHVSSYQITTPNDLSQNRLADLLERINAIPGVKRIRLSSLEPRVVTEDFVSRISKLSKLCHHFHLSLQSGCDETLKRMNRHYTAAQYKNGVELLRRYMDNPAITTDIIAGFPGETADEFEQSYLFAKEIGFYEMHVFKYSKRAGTVAAGLPKQVCDADKDARSARLISLGEQLSKDFRQSYLGCIRPVLLEEKVKIAGKEYFIGHTPEYIKVAVDTEGKSNEIADILLTDFLADDILVGNIC